MAMTNAERQKKFREKQREITDQLKAAELERKRKEIIRYVETMPTDKVMKLYSETVEEQRMFDDIYDISDVDLDACLSDIAS